MILYFMRHAEAEAHAASDHVRVLTKRGIARTETAARVLKNMSIQPKHIYASPRVRATQTAEIVAGALGVMVEVREEVNFDFSREKVEQMITGLNPEDEVMFVGHEPTMSEVVGALTGGLITMKKGGLARVDVVSLGTPLRGRLVWLIAPKVFDAVDA